MESLRRRCAVLQLKRKGFSVMGCSLWSCCQWKEKEKLYSSCDLGGKVEKLLYRQTYTTTILIPNATQQNYSIVQFVTFSRCQFSFSHFPSGYCFSLIVSKNIFPKLRSTPTDNAYTLEEAESRKKECFVCLPKSRNNDSLTFRDPHIIHMQPACSTATTYS